MQTRLLHAFVVGSDFPLLLFPYFCMQCEVVYFDGVKTCNQGVPDREEKEKASTVAGFIDNSFAECVFYEGFMYQGDHYQMVVYGDGDHVLPYE